MLRKLKVRGIIFGILQLAFTSVCAQSHQNWQSEVTVSVIRNEFYELTDYVSSISLLDYPNNQSLISLTPKVVYRFNPFQVGVWGQFDYTVLSSNPENSFQTYGVSGWGGGLVGRWMFYEAEGLLTGISVESGVLKYYLNSSGITVDIPFELSALSTKTTLSIMGELAFNEDIWLNGALGVGGLLSDDVSIGNESFNFNYLALFLSFGVSFK